MSTKIITIDEAGQMEYDWTAIDAAAMRHAIAPAVLRAFAHDAVTDAMTADELVYAYFADRDARLEAAEEDVYRHQAEWAERNPGFVPTTGRTDAIIARHIQDIDGPGEALRAAVFAAMDEWRRATEADV